MLILSLHVGFPTENHVALTTGFAYMMEILDDNLTWLETPVCKDVLVIPPIQKGWLSHVLVFDDWSVPPKTALEAWTAPKLRGCCLFSSKLPSKAPEISWINQAESNQATFQTAPKQKDINRKKQYSFYHHGSGKWLYLKANHTYWRYTHFSLNHAYGRNNKVPGTLLGTIAMSHQQITNLKILFHLFPRFRYVTSHGGVVLVPVSSAISRYFETLSTDHPDRCQRVVVLQGQWVRDTLGRLERCGTTGDASLGGAMRCQFGAKGWWRNFPAFKRRSYF